MNSNTDGPDGATPFPIDRQWVASRVAGELVRQEADIADEFEPLTGFNQNVSGAAGFLKLYYGVRCRCTTAAVLSIEISGEKTVEEIAAAMPALVDRLRVQRRAFIAMPCSAHKRMRTAMFGSQSKQSSEMDANAKA